MAQQAFRKTLYMASRYLRGREFLQNLLYLLIILLLVGRLIGFPVYLSIVPSKSMEPTLRPGDLVLVERYPDNIEKGDIVVWCLAPLHCIVHRVINISGDTITTKGDANPGPDPPVSVDRVKGRVFLKIPREAWITTLLFLAIIYAWRRGVPRGSIAAVYLLIAAAVLVSAPPIYNPLSPASTQATVLKSSYITDNGIVVLEYGGYPPSHVDSCSAILVSLTTNCTVTVDVEHATLILGVPSTFYLRASQEYNRTPLLTVRVRGTTVGDGVFNGTYMIPIPADKLVINVSENATELVIRNPNPYPVPVHIFIGYAKHVMPITNGTNQTVSVNGHSTVRISLPDEPYFYVEVRYKVFGKPGYFAGAYNRGG